MSRVGNVISYELREEDVIQQFAAAFEVGRRPVPPGLTKVLEAGKFFALAPEGLTYERILQFRTGGLVPAFGHKRAGKYLISEKGSLAASLTRVVGANLRHRASFAFMREPYLEAGDANEIVGELSEVDGELYKIIDLNLTDQIELSSDIRRFSVPWSFLLFVTSKAPCEDVNELLATASLIAINAYDDESYIYWLRN